MTRIGRFKSDAARETYLRAYAALEELWPLPSTQVDVPTRFGSTHVRRSGSGDGVPLVLLHGFGGNGLYWHDVVEGLARGRVVYALDTVGSAGRSVQTAPLSGDADYGAWFSEVLDGLGLDRVHVLGESQGAWHATLVALHAADRVASVSLIEPNGVVARIPVRALLKMLTFGANPTDEGWRKMAEWLTPGVTMTDVEWACMKAAQGYRTAAGWARPLKDAELESIAPPLLAIYGAESVLSDPPVASRRLAEHLPDAEIETFPGVGHGLRGQIPDQVTARTVKFMARHDEAVRPGR
ncbi:pimeloyl-ACP methyl ester carboxylesterase [Promicromonospora sp. AC04]|uniref:alpha/beta fold hydrolase n=1 Tax=Promicromonospora sp. AC04 TaxID=2135723 RepID=UPI000D3729BD|nr:alpha/beta fold hydrolase [Promicromonospora sp. AC04]PUB24462.1 pimeloyl-ACP methyl ester carboxylesterase [Promicromonospora sp. AC04]